MRILLLVVTLLLSYPSSAVVRGEFLGAKTVDVLPDWFKTTFMDFSEDIVEATDENRHVMIYFHQSACPYCAKLVEDNFNDEALVAKLKANFDSIETNMWGDRELTDWEGREFNEKEFSSFMKVQFTPTIIFLDSEGEIVLRLNGYQSIEKMHVVLDYVSTKKYLNQTFARYINSLKTNAVGELNKNTLFESAPHLLTRSDRFPAQKYLAVFFEEPNCPECDTFHQTFMKLDQTKALFKSMQVIQLNALSDEKLITPSGKKSTASQWYDDLKLTYKPAVVFFDKQGKEIIRKDAFFKTYHFHGIITYVLSGKYKEQPNFQRYLEGKSDKLRDQGITVDIWK